MTETAQSLVTREEFQAAMTRIEELLRESKPLPPIISRAEAKCLSRQTSDANFSRWCAKWGVSPSTYARYSRAQIELALKREAGELPTPATLRKKWEGAT